MLGLGADQYNVHQVYDYTQFLSLLCPAFVIITLKAISIEPYVYSPIQPSHYHELGRVQSEVRSMKVHPKFIKW